MDWNFPGTKESVKSSDDLEEYIVLNTFLIIFIFHFPFDFLNSNQIFKVQKTKFVFEKKENNNVIVFVF